MSQYKSVKLGKVYTLTLKPGDDILSSINDVVSAERLTDAVFLTGIGNIINCSTHFAVKQSDGTYRDIPRTFRDTPFEISGVQGFIEKREDGRSRIHLHGVIGDPNESWTIHIHEGCTVLHNFKIAFAQIIE